MQRLLSFLAGVIFMLSGPALAADATLAKNTDGSFTATMPNYTAQVGPDGNLHSLNCGGTEFLCDGYRGLVGGAYLTVKEGPAWSVEVFKFTAVEQKGPDTVTATADKHKLTYKFLPDAIELAFANTTEPYLWYLAINPAIKDMWERDLGEAITLKTSGAGVAGVPHLFATNGANVILPQGLFWHIARSALEKPDTDPMLAQIAMRRTGGDARIVIHAKPAAADALQATLAIPLANHIFPGGAPAEIGVTGKMRFPNLAVDGEVELVVKDFLKENVVFQKSQPFKLAALGEGKVSFSMTPPAGFYDAVLTVKQGAEVLATRPFPMAYDIEHMAPPERPADFDKFWDATLAEQAKIPANLQMTLYKEETNRKLYKIRFDGLMGRQFYAWLSIPKKEGKYPCWLMLPPTGVMPPYLPPDKGDRVAMGLAIAGQEPEPPPGGYQNWDYYRSGIEKRETWYYRVVFAACSRAVDLLAARPEVDAKRIFVQGSSQGGGLTFITAALNSNVTMAVSGVPGLFGLEWKLRYPGRSYWPVISIGNDDKQPADPKALEERIAVVRYGDAANFAPRITCPILLIVGLQDRTTAPAGVLSAWQRLGNARIRAMLADPLTGHSCPRSWQWMTLMGNRWFDKLAAGQVDGVAEFKTANDLPVIVDVKK